MSDKLIITNKKIIDFYKSHTCFDFENVNLHLVHMLENTVSDTNKLSGSAITQIFNMLNEHNSKLDFTLKNMENTNTSMLQQFITNKDDIKENLKHIRELIMSQKSDIENIIVSKLSNVKQQYIDEVKTLLLLSEQNINNTVNNKLENINGQIIDKLYSTIYDVLPKFSEPISNQINHCIDTFKSSLTIETLKLNDEIKRSNNTELLNSFILQFNTRYNELIKTINEPIINYITGSEERIKNNEIDKTNLLKSFISNEIVTVLETVKNNNSSDVINNYIQSFDTRYDSMLKSIQNPLIQTITTTEDRLTRNIADIKTIVENSNNTNELVNKNLTEHLNKYKSSTIKGQISENKLYNDLCRLYTEAEITNTSATDKSGDILFIRKNKANIRFENKEYSYNVPESEVDKFKRDLAVCKDSHGIFLSQTSGIANRCDWTLEKYDNRFILFLHNVNSDMDKIKMAIKVIDLLHETITPSDNTVVKNDSIVSLDENDISKISNELFNILTIKTKLLNQVSETKKTIEEIDIPYLRELIIKHAGSESLKNTMIKCDYCDFTATTRRAVTAHINHQHTDKYKKNKGEIMSDDVTSLEIKEDENKSDSETVIVTETKKNNRKKKETGK
jgi:uncharacterized C2H2 Zn-finger protein